MTPSSLAGKRARLSSRSSAATSGAVRSSALSLRQKLRDRRIISVQRHTGRLTTRFLTLLVGDILGIFVYRGLSSALTESHLVGNAIRNQVGDAMASQAFGGWIFALLLLASLFVTGSYSRHRALNGRVRLLGSAALASTLVLITVAPASGWLPAGVFYVFTLVVAWIVLLGERQLVELLLRYVWPRDSGTAPALLITTGTAADAVIERAILAPGGDYRIAARMHSTDREFGAPNGSWPELADAIEQGNIEAVVLCDALPPRRMESLVDIAINLGCQLLYPARAVNLPDVRPTLVWHSDQPFFELGAPVLKATALVTKRIVDIIGALIGIALCGPLLALIAIGVKLDSPGPVLFIQERAGLGGKRFKMLKFRTMRADADGEKSTLSHLNQSGDPRLFKILGDPRITRIGHFLRRWSFDELPQIFNVLMGDMSLVGPRPFFEADLLHYEDHHFRRLDAKPGITGLWQVSGGSEMINFDDVVFLDRQYIEQWSFWLDVSIVFRTLPAIFRRSGVY